jgi:hypothetical protein
MVSGFLAFGPLERQNIMLGTHGREATHLVVTMKQKEKKEGPRFQYLLLGHILNNLASSY